MNYSNIKILKDVELPSYFNNEIIFKKWEKFPYVRMNGIFCFPINAFLQSSSMIRLKYSSIIKSAYSLSHLVSYCEDKNIELNNFNEGNFVDLSKNLSNIGISNNSINYTLKNVLHFFEFYGVEFLDEKNYIQKMFNAEINLDSRTSEEYFYHPCFLPKSELKTRNPMHIENIEKIYNEIDNLYSNQFAQKRTKVILKLLEITGARVSEISNIKILDIENALLDKNLLKVKTLKRKQGEHRFIPVSKEKLSEIITYIKIFRSKIIKKTIGTGADHGYLLISEKTGQQLTSNTISNDMIRLRNLAGIEQQTCAHMFRHRFITNMFIKLMEQYDFENKDSFKNALMDLETLKIHIKEISGHKNISSLDHYIHLAKSELTNMEQVLNKVFND
jgi:site-specific recombinase XerD